VNANQALIGLRGMLDGGQVTLRVLVPAQKVVHGRGDLRRRQIGTLQLLGGVRVLSVGAQPSWYAVIVF
jgi:hypothetical protein